jgi:2-polyprenyl-3-methyl-5-hydroxy-6-metoxy-1,4-benzoquinol methylase
MTMVILDKKVIRRLAEYFQLTDEQAVCMIKVGTRLNKEFWDILDPKTDAQVREFYRLVPSYPFSLSYGHMLRAQVNFRRKIVKMSGGEVLDYGGGVGDLSLALAKRACKVVYADIGGKTFAYAKWLLAREGHGDIPVMDVESDRDKIWSNKYDTIICLDVLEHIPRSEDILALMAGSLRNKGKLIITGLDCYGATDEQPMHLKINYDFQKLLNRLSIYQSNNYDWCWIKNEIDVR